MAEAWRLIPADEERVRGLASGLGMRTLTARILAARGFSSPDSAARFLSPKLSDLRPPVGMADLDRAMDRLCAALHRRERVAVFGDYDVDGVTSAAVLVLTLRALGLDVVARMAKRASGYGFSPADADWFVAQGCTLVLTADCGTSDVPALLHCRERGVDVIVIDHHHVPTEASPAYALLNSHRCDDTFCFKGLASCGVAFYLAAATRTRLRQEGHPPAERFDPRCLLDLVALGTIADLVPLTHENRILVAGGLRELRGLRRPGLSALADVAGMPETGLGATEVSFRLAPRLNAAGRLGDAQLALDLLLADDLDAARRLATELDELNRRRQKIQEQIWQEAVVQAELQADAPSLVVGAEGWHQGVVGIVAAKLVDRYRKPAVVIGFSGGQGRGSARTVAGFDLYQGLSRCRAYLTSFGGHPMAAGVVLAESNLMSFRCAFAEAAGDATRLSDSAAVEVDAVANLAEIDVPLAEELGRLAPFGNANCEPLIAVPGVIARSTRVVGSSHLQLTLAHGSAVSDAIAFGMGDLDPGQGARLDVIGVAEVDEFRGQRRLRLRLRHVMRSRS